MTYAEQIRECRDELLRQDVTVKRVREVGQRLDAIADSVADDEQVERARVARRQRVTLATVGGRDVRGVS